MTAGRTASAGRSQYQSAGADHATDQYRALTMELLDMRSPSAAISAQTLDIVNAPTHAHAHLLPPLCLSRSAHGLHAPRAGIAVH